MKAATPPCFWSWGHGVQRQRGLAARLGPVDLDHPPARVAADAERQVEARRTRRDHLDLAVDGVLRHGEDRPLAELLLDRRDGEVDRLAAVVVVLAVALAVAGHVSFSSRVRVNCG